MPTPDVFTVALKIARDGHIGALEKSAATLEARGKVDSAETIRHAIATVRAERFIHTMLNEFGHGGI